MLIRFLAAAFLLASYAAHAQQGEVPAPDLNPTDPRKFGEPLTITLEPAEGSGRTFQPVKLQMRVRYKQNTAGACVYEYRLRNTSTTQGLVVKYVIADQPERTFESRPGQAVLVSYATRTACGSPPALVVNGTRDL